jgi:glucokinase
MANLIGIDIGGTKCSVVLGRENAGTIDVLTKVTFPTATVKGPEQALDRILGAVLELISGSDGAVEGIGISCGGPLDSKRGLILSPPNLPGWDNVPIIQICEQRFGIGAWLQNDANACALAEWRWGAAKGYHNAVFLTFGTGMGAGLILNGRLYSGTNDMAGEVGHIRLTQNGPVCYGKAGSFEGWCSGGGIAQLARSMALEQLQMGEKVAFCSGMGALDGVDAKMVADAAWAGDPLAMEIYRVCGAHLGQGLSVIVDILNPEVIVIGSIFARCRELLWPSACEVMERECLTLSRGVCTVLPAGLGETIGDVAALAVACSD